jgi:hypothetical protein
MVCPLPRLEGGACGALAGVKESFWGLHDGEPPKTYGISSNICGELARRPL